jgi:hypothetical protein
LPPKKLLKRQRSLESKESTNLKDITLKPSFNYSKCNNKKKQKVLYRTKKQLYKEIILLKMLLTLVKVNLRPCYKKVELRQVKLIQKILRKDKFHQILIKHHKLKMTNRLM